MGSECPLLDIFMACCLMWGYLGVCGGEMGKQSQKMVTPWIRKKKGERGVPLFSVLWIESRASFCCLSHTRNPEFVFLRQSQKYFQG
jgi:hypothetical protein